MQTRAEKLKQAGIKRYGSEAKWREAIAAQGSKGGKTKGAVKRRGDKEYYKAIGKQGGLNRGKNKAV